VAPAGSVDPRQGVVELGQERFRLRDPVSEGVDRVAPLQRHRFRRLAGGIEGAGAFGDQPPIALEPGIELAAGVDRA
jgi:hypothetical protein